MRTVFCPIPQIIELGDTLSSLIRYLTPTLVWAQAMDTATFLLAASMLDIDLSLQGETNFLVRWLWGEAGPTGLILAKGLTITLVLLMIKATLLGQQRRTTLLALMVLTAGAMLGVTGAGYNLYAALKYGSF